MDLYVLCLASRTPISYVDEVNPYLSCSKKNPYIHAWRDGCLFVTPQGEWLFLMIRETDACTLWFLKRPFVYHAKRIFIYHIPLGGHLFLMSAKWILLHYAPRSWCLFPMITKWILICYHGLRSRALLRFVRRMLIYDALLRRCLSLILCEADVCLLCSVRWTLTPMLREVST